MSQPHSPASYSQPRQKSTHSALDKVLALDNFETAAQRFLPAPIFAYIAGTAEQGQSWQDNQSAFREHSFLPRVLRNVAQRSQSMELFGKSWSAPFGIAPMGLSALVAYRGDIVLAKTARQLGIPMILSGSSLIRMEEVLAAAPDTWFQAYLPGEPERIRALLVRAATAGCKTLLLTADVPVLGNRENLIRGGFSTPLRPSLTLALDGLTHPRWLTGTFLRTLLQHGMPHFENSFAERGAPILSRNVLRDFSQRDHFDWSHVAQIRQQWQGKLIIKGILHPDDAQLAREHGADGIILSNHGGRQLDGAIAPLRILTTVRQQLGADYPVMLDSGIRRGGDILKALALGASFVFIGRPFLYAATIAGEAGVQHAHQLLYSEIDRNMALLGIRHPKEITPNYLTTNKASE